MMFRTQSVEQRVVIAKVVGSSLSIHLKRKIPIGIVPTGILFLRYSSSLFSTAEIDCRLHLSFGEGEFLDANILKVSFAAGGGGYAPEDGGVASE